MDKRLIGLSSWVVKDGVMLGGLPQPLRMQVLALVWAGLPSQGRHTEREINKLLKTQLATTACFVATDHVELRRWLVDMGWLARDGFGREYRCVGPAGMRPEQGALAAAVLCTVGEHGAAAWVQAVRQAWQAQRDARRKTWQAQSGAQHVSQAAATVVHAAKDSL